MSSDSPFEDVWNLLPKHRDGNLIIIPSPEAKRIMHNDDEYSLLPDYLRFGNPDQTVTSEGVYSRVWTSERIEAEQPPEAIVLSNAKVEWTHQRVEPIDTDVDFGVLPAGGFTLSFDITDYGRNLFDYIIYGMLSESDRQEIGRKLLAWADKYGHSYIYKPQGSRRAARRRLSKRRGKR